MSILSFARLAALLQDNSDKLPEEAMLQNISWATKRATRPGLVEKDMDSDNRESKQRIRDLEETVRDYESFMRQIVKAQQPNKGAPMYVDPKWVHGLEIPDVSGVKRNDHELAIVFDPLGRTFATLNKAILYPSDYVEIPLPRYHAPFDVITIFGVAGKKIDKQGNPHESVSRWHYVAKARKGGYKRGLKSAHEVIITFPLGFLGGRIILKRLLRKITTLHILVTRPEKYRSKIFAKGQLDQDDIWQDVKGDGDIKDKGDEASMRIITKSMLKDLCTTDVAKEEMKRIRNQPRDGTGKGLAIEILRDLLHTPPKLGGEVRYYEAVQVLSELLANSSSIRKAAKELVAMIMQDGAAKLARLIEEDAEDTRTPDCIETGGQTPLHFAARRGLVNVVEDLFRSEGGHMLGVDAPDPYGRTPLILAAANGHIEVVECLLNRSLAIDVQDSLGRTALSWAAAATDKEPRSHQIVHRLLEKKANMHLYDDSGVDALSWAAAAGNLETVKILLDSGAEPNSKANPPSRTPLWWAAGSGHLRVVEHLFKHGALPDAEDKFGRTPLSWAAANGHNDVVNRLLDCGAKIDSRDKEYDRTPLSRAAEGGHLSVIQTLFYAGKKNNMKADSGTSARGRTPLSYAAAGGHFEAVKFLLDVGADVDGNPLSLPASDKPVQEPSVQQASSQQTPTAAVALPPSLRRTPLSWAATGGYEDIVRRLLENDAKIEAQDEFGRTPLWYAAQGGHVAVLRLLLANRASTNVRDFRGKTPQDIAKDRGHLGAMEVLEGRITDVE